MKKNGITYYSTNPIYTNDNFLTNAVGESGFFTNDEKKTIGLTGKEIDNNFLTLEGRDVYKLYVSGKTVILETLNGKKYSAGLDNLIGQANWNETDKTSQSYILNKPTKVSQFVNDSNFTSVSLTGTIPEGDGAYEIAVFSLNGKQTILYGKNSSSSINGIEAEYDETMDAYLINITDSMFSENSVNEYVCFCTDEETTTDGRYGITFNSGYSFTIEEGTSFEQTPTENAFTLKDFPKNDICIKYNPNVDLLIKCISTEDGKALEFSSFGKFVKSTVTTYKVKITNKTENEKYIINATFTNDTLFDRVTLKKDEVQTIKIVESKKIIAKCVNSTSGSAVEIKWTVKEGTTSQKDYTGESITLTISADTEIICYSIAS